MSRYEFSQNGKDVSIGWDRPMNTFFVQIHNPKAKSDRDYCELWLGGNFDEFTDLNQLLQKLDFQIDNSLQVHLVHDQKGISNLVELPSLSPTITKRF